MIAVARKWIKESLIDRLVAQQLAYRIEKTVEDRVTTQLCRQKRPQIMRKKQEFSRLERKRRAELAKTEQDELVDKIKRRVVPTKSSSSESPSSSSSESVTLSSSATLSASATSASSMTSATSATSMPSLEILQDEAMDLLTLSSSATSTSSSTATSSSLLTATSTCCQREEAQVDVPLDLTTTISNNNYYRNKEIFRW
ncbi:uncharacterized protein LOC131667097 [Phymastichus coffea]|uniref:uncharacterized protein LOC131667097 n=1 Tax=Phymastichus coffea TaxID=108790 RepID=UPI00273AFE01|nr:uncharacterized protein LOC131667097 [Phymastichus coffea]